VAAAARPTPAPQRVALATLALRDYRNIAHADLTLPHEGVAIVGENGHGKTNLLEAIAYLELLRSIRGVRDRDLVRFGAPAFHIGVTCAGTSANAIGLGVDRAGRKRVTLDGVETPRLTDALGAVPSVCVSPADVVLIAGSPAERRRYLDIVLALTSAPYLSALRHYRAALARRNAALRDAGKRSASVAAIAAWEPALAEHGAVLVDGRRAWVAEYAPTFASLVTAIGEPGAMAMAYESPLRERADVRTALAALLEKGRDHDLRRGITQAGPHRDDLAVTLDGRDLRLVGSAGQQRTAAIALRLLEATTFRSRRDLQPLLLLDDPFAELDRRRASNVLALLDAASDHGAGQTIICVPREDEIPATFTRLPRWRVTQGVFAPLGGA
jgi:DNA replication and repair protein RecF